MNIVVETKTWLNLLRRAKKRFPKEYIEFVWGEETVDSFRIVKFQPIEHKASKTGIEYDADTFANQRALAKAEGLTVLGTIHTHPHYYEDCSASQIDHHGAVVDGEKLMGILGITKAKSGKLYSKVQWWLPQPPMKFIKVD